MSTPESGRYVVPTPRIPKTLGTLHIVFGTLIIMCSTCSGVYVAVLPVFGRAMNDVTKKAEDQMKAQRQAQIKSLEEQEKTAESEEEKTQIRQARESLETQGKQSGPMIPTMDMTQMGLDDPKFLLYSWGDVVSSLIVNILMLIAGIGLVGMKRWGVKLGLWVAGVKIVRLLLVYGFFIVAVAAPVGQKMGRAVGGMMEQQQKALGRPMPGGAPPAELFIKIYTIYFTAIGVGMMIGGVVYPALSLWLLSRPGTWAACVQASRSQEPTESW